jgi:hypothetical protein
VLERLDHEVKFTKPYTHHPLGRALASAAMVDSPDRAVTRVICGLGRIDLSAAYEAAVT